jgi:hypothetical protein
VEQADEYTGRRTSLIGFRRREKERKEERRRKSRKRNVGRRKYKSKE